MTVKDLEKALFPFYQDAGNTSQVYARRTPVVEVSVPCMIYAELYRDSVRSISGWMVEHPNPRTSQPYNWFKIITPLSTITVVESRITDMTAWKIVITYP